MSQYKTLTAEEIKNAQNIDRQISDWADVDYQADMGIYNTIADFKKSFSYSSSRVELLKELSPLGVSAEGVSELLAKVKQKPLKALKELLDLYSSIDKYDSRYKKSSLEHTRDKYKEYKEKGEHAQNEIYKLNQQYTGWRRFWLVPGGHIHDNYDCSTCHKMGKATQMSWLWELSGMSLEDAVKQYGHIICSVCYPDAPLDWSSMSHGQAERENGRCEGSGEYLKDAEYNWRKRSNYAECPHCGGRFIINNMKVLRAHKPYVDPNCPGSGKEPERLVGDTYGICSECGKRRQLSWRNNSVMDVHKRAKEVS